MPCVGYSNVIGLNAAVSWKLGPAGLDQAAGATPSCGRAGPPGRLMRKTLNRHACPRLGPQGNRGGGVEGLQPGPRQPGESRPPLNPACAVPERRDRRRHAFPVPIGQRRQRWPRREHAQVADDVDGADLELGVVAAGPVHVEKRSRRLPLPRSRMRSRVVIVCHGASSKASKRTCRAIGPARAKTRPIGVGPPRNRDRVVPDGSVGVEEHRARLWQAHDAVAGRVVGGRPYR